MCSALLILCSNFGAQEAKAQSSAVSPLVDDPSPKPVKNPSEVKPMSTNCYTNENKLRRAHDNRAVLNMRSNAQSGGTMVPMVIPP
jgi:hypothetical protein